MTVTDYYNDDHCYSGSDGSDKQWRSWNPHRLSAAQSPPLRPGDGDVDDVPQSELMRKGNFLGQAYTILAGVNESVEAMGSQDNSPLRK